MKLFKWMGNAVAIAIIACFALGIIWIVLYWIYVFISRPFNVFL